MDATEREMNQVRLIALSDPGRSIPLFCFPGAGGAVDVFRELALLMDSHQPIYGIDVQNFLDADREFSVEQIAEGCLSLIRETQRCGPYFVCGYSFGALVAYEVATRLRSTGEAVGIVALIDTGNPAFVTTLSSAETQQLGRSYLAGRLRKYVRILAKGNIRAFAGGLLAVLAARTGVRTRRLIRHIFLSANRPMPEILRNNDRALFDAWRNYVPPAGALPLLLYCDAHRISGYGGDRTLGWGLCTSADIEIELATAGHVNMMRFPHVLSFVGKLSAFIGISFQAGQPLTGE
jgi:thioesterase domain-containing protein